MGFKPRKDPFHWLFLILLGAGVLFLCYIIATGQRSRTERLQQMGSGSIYKADEPLDSMPNQLMEGMILLTPEQMARIPLADGFQWPTGAPGMAMMYDAQPFGSPTPQRGGLHTGQDLNGIGGNDTDEGEPVRAAARGLVVYSGIPHQHWGNIVVIAHRLPGKGQVIQTLYAHLKDRKAKPGQLVERGQRIGSIGTADGLYLAHLHFEIAESRCIEAGMPGYHPNGVMNRTNPADFIARHPAPPMPDPYHAVRRLLIREAALSAPAQHTPAAEPTPGSIPVSPSQFIQP